MAHAATSLAPGRTLEQGNQQRERVSGDHGCACHGLTLIMNRWDFQPWRAPRHGLGVYQAATVPNPLQPATAPASPYSLLAGVHVRLRLQPPRVLC